MTLQQIVRAMPRSTLIGDPHVRIRGITHDSRAVRQGDLFACVPGFRFDGHRFAEEAVHRGASALLVNRELPAPVPQIITDDTRYAMGLASSCFFGHPSKKLRVIGVTGTNGKTTTSFFIRDVLTGKGDNCGLIGTIGQWTGDEFRTSSRTTPESTEIQKLFRDMVDDGLSACAMEVSSHGLVLQRVVGTSFSTAVMTNISRDHFDFHGNFEAYIRAKIKLFSMIAADDDAAKRFVVVNGDDRYACHFIRAITNRSPSIPIITYGLKKGNDLSAEDIRTHATGVSYIASTPKGKTTVSLSLPGKFNVYNSLAALGVAFGSGIDMNTAARRISSTVVPGRFEPVSSEGGFFVIVDYAHSPDSLENALVTARELTEGRIIVVFGAGGDRDPGKRPVMGEIAVEYADLVFFTSDNPRSEDPYLICTELAAGAKLAKSIKRNGAKYRIVVDRRDAIEAAINAARPDDIVLIAGKGHETYQEIDGVCQRFDDREVARSIIRQKIKTRRLT